MRIAFLTLTLVLLQVLSQSKTLKEVSSSSALQKIIEVSMANNKLLEVDSLEQINIYMPKIIGNYSIKQNVKAKWDLNLFSVAWDEANEAQETRLDYTQNDLENSVDLEKHKNTDVFMLFSQIDKEVFITGITGGREQIMVFYLPLAGIDVNNSKDLELVMNMFQYDFLLKSRIDYTNVNFQTREGLVEYSTQYNSKQIQNFAMSVKGRELVIGEGDSNKKVIKALDEEWSFTSFKVVDDVTFQSLIKTKDDATYRIYIQKLEDWKGVSKAHDRERASLYLINNQNNQILYSVSYMYPKAHGGINYERVVRHFSLSLNNSDYFKSTDHLLKDKFDYHSLPRDVASKTVGYIELVKGQPAYKKVNNQFEKKMKQYPYNFVVIEPEKSDAIKKAAYQLKYSFKTVLVQRTYHDPKTNRITFKTVQEVRYFVYLEDIKTEETYCVQENALKLSTAFKKFVKAASAIK